MLTAWDGYTRVDYLPGRGRVRVSLLTLEPVVHLPVRWGLACAFVAGDLTGPPAFLEIDVGWGETEDLLLGRPLLDVIAALLLDGGGSRHVRLNLDEVEGLAERWAPYRSQVLGTPAESGPLADGFWTLFVAHGFDRMLRELASVLSPAFRDGDDPEPDWWPIVLPAQLAHDAGVAPELRWVAYREENPASEVETGIVVRATALPGRAGRLLAGLDDLRDAWVELEPDPDDPSLLVADLPVLPGSGDPALRFRSEGRWTSRSSQVC